MKKLRFFPILAYFSASIALALPPRPVQGSEPHPWQLQPSDLTVIDQSEAKATARVGQLHEQRDRVAPHRYNIGNYPINETHETHWRQTLWATAILEPRSPEVNGAFSHIISLALNPNLSNSQKRTVNMAMQVGTQLYLSDREFYATIGDRFLEILRNSPYPEWSSMALSALVQGGMSPDVARQEMENLRDRFSRTNDLFLQVALQDIQEQLEPSPLPPLTDLLQWQIAPQQAQIYILCRPDREVLCLAVLKDRNGEFVKGENGELWSVSLLARSLHGLRWNYFRGITPQGIYRIEGFMPRLEPNYFRAYGQFPLVKLFLPFENGVKAFLPDRKGTLSTRETYENLLPPSWRKYFPIQQAYWAGRRGRSLIRIHGSGEPPSFFSNNQNTPNSYEWNPAIGCISAIELYDDGGRLVRADMPKILQALNDAAGGRVEGYALLVELEASDRPISLGEVEEAID